MKKFYYLSVGIICLSFFAYKLTNSAQTSFSFGRRIDEPMNHVLLFKKNRSKIKHLITLKHGNNAPISHYAYDDKYNIAIYSVEMKKGLIESLTLKRDASSNISGEFYSNILESNIDFLYLINHSSIQSNINLNIKSDSLDILISNDSVFSVYSDLKLLSIQYDDIKNDQLNVQKKGLNYFSNINNGLLLLKRNNRLYFIYIVIRINEEGDLDRNTLNSIFLNPA